ncbi:E3 ubiquitin-protein ligase TRAF7 [Thecamonas trahens ATCC 50062]|uniref:E3 ubiquitin-protein ligase TRAF7 n=1 Tax=Thecamonas trahens ATCC 50062 TaxID=461836 RepID=A0A0L0DBC8_THETB|nr:E3 ubiquitin-protein ligase TRAF7 [Thecamonas trahens ATCC 50062]KNC49632.1 E3 ubiquitin-protein ligase TRAF7 [Thecamonas trahens ATCC 50062]|eukprot:XP_013757736.1 E3 ubiquitin-protein ligase TRAF7 [Thecamonas trahens ATCC 50062]
MALVPTRSVSPTPRQVAKGDQGDATSSAGRSSQTEMGVGGDSGGSSSQERQSAGSMAREVAEAKAAQVAAKASLLMYEGVGEMPKPQKFVTPPSDSLICPIHLGLFVEPAIARCGHTFCRECILESLDHMAQCPVDAQPLEKDMLVPNLAVKGQINDLIVFCPYGLKQADNADDLGLDDQWVVDELGCSARLRIGDLAAHERECEFRPVVCPNSVKCGLLRAAALEAHLETCGRIGCPNAVIGCDFESTIAGVEEHLPGCKFEAMKDVMAATNAQFTELKDMLVLKDREIALLTQTVLDLSHKLENLAGNIEHKLDIYDQTICKMHISIEDTRRQVGHSLDEITMVKQRIGSEADTQIYPHLYRCKGTVSGHSGPVWTLAATETLLFSGSSDETIRVWSLATYQCLHTLEGHNGIVHALVVYHGVDGDMLISGSSDCTIRVWDVTSFECVRTIDTNENVCTLAVHNNLLFAGTLKQILVHDLETFEIVHELKDHNHWVRAMTIHENVLYAGSYNTIKAWDLTDFTCKATIQCSDGSVYSLAVTGPYLVSGTFENRVQVFERTSHELVHSLQGHIGTVYAVIAVPGYVFSGSYDNTVKVWNIKTWQCVQTLVRHTSSVDALIFAHNKLFSGSADNSIKVWQ